MKVFLLTLMAAALLLTANAARSNPGMVYTYDARPLRSLDLGEPKNAARVWDTLHLLAALQGLVNRKSPRFYLFYCAEFGTDTDQFWWDWLRGEDGWLRTAEVRPLSDVDAALQAFRSDFRGLVVYDPRVPATSNLASTAAGCESLLPVRFDPAPGSLFMHLTQERHLPVKLWLVNADGSSKFTDKIDAYRWALARYLKPRRCDPHFAAFYVDAAWLAHPKNAGPDMHALSNHDYFVSHRAFFFDLSPWADEAPNDDPNQTLGSDRQMLLDVLRGLYDGARGDIVKIGGFPPWPFKYTTRTGGKHEGVPTEWEFTRLISQFNAYHEADAANVGAMANASFLQHYPLARRHPQPNPVPTEADWRAKGYLEPDGKVAPRCFLAHYVGDYDAPSWLSKSVAAFFADKARGQVPLGWAFDPNLSDRAPQAMAYAYRHATPNDFFIAGDSGAGYLNPRALTVRPDSHLPSGLEKWTAYCKKYYARWGMTITGFMLDGSAGGTTEREIAAYKTFSPDGLGLHYARGPEMHLDVPTNRLGDLPDDVEKAASDIARDAAGSDSKPVFLWRRSILKSPSWYAELSRILREKYPQARVKVVDPYTFFGLLKRNLTPP